MPEIRNFMTSQVWGPHHDVELLDMMEMESLKMEIGNFKLIKIAFKCWEAAQNKQVRILMARAILKITKGHEDGWA